MKIKFLGTHNTESKTTRLTSILIDGVLAIDAGSLNAGLTFAEQKRIEAILLTHGHYDHIRSIPAFAFANTRHQTPLYASKKTFELLSLHLMDGEIYPKFDGPTPLSQKPVVKLVPVQANKTKEIAGYRVTAVPMRHLIDDFGYEVASEDGKKIFYTGDTGPGLAAAWKHISPDLLIIDSTFPSTMEKMAITSGHLCPSLIKKELLEFHRIKSYLPRVVFIHISPQFEEEIKKEAENISIELAASVTLAVEDEVINI